MRDERAAPIEQIGVYFNQAVATFNGGDLEGALTALAKIRPEHGRYHYEAQAYRGQILLRRGELAAAEACLVEAANHLPGAEATFKYAEFLFAQKRFDEAETAYRKVLARDAALPDAYTRLGMILRGRGEIPAAIRALEQALLLDPRAMVARFVLAQICVGQADPLRALSQLHMVLYAQPQFAPARKLQAEIFQRLGDHRQALVEFELYLRLNPTDAGALVQLAKSFLALGDLKQAATAFERAHRANPKLHDALKAAAEQREALRHFKTACGHYRRLAKHPQFRSLAEAALARLAPLADSEPESRSRGDDEASGFEVPMAHPGVSTSQVWDQTGFWVAPAPLPERPHSSYRSPGAQTVPLPGMGRSPTRSISPPSPPSAPPVPPAREAGATIEPGSLEDALRAVGESLKSTFRSWLARGP